MLVYMDVLHYYLADWDKCMREFAAKKLTDLANEWQSSDCELDEDGNLINYIEITKADFAEKLPIDSMDMDGECKNCKIEKYRGNKK